MIYLIFVHSPKGNKLKTEKNKPGGSNSSKKKSKKDSSKGDDDTDSEEERWLDAIESGKLEEVCLRQIIYNQGTNKY